MHSFASMLGDAMRDDWMHILLIALGLCLLEFGFGWISKKRAAQVTADHQVLALEKRIGDLQGSLDELRKEKDEMLSTELTATRTMLSSFVKQQQELLQKWQDLLMAQETRHRENVERSSFPHETAARVPQFIPANYRQGFDFSFQEAEGDPCENQAMDRPVDREALQAGFAQYMETVTENDVESGGCPSPDYGGCDRSSCD
ncbi:hypothetical protein BSKO_03976 [Bryopsis sp. KO-2023]|nr:hypothetical protein BSKO_03976 [Bryopsis sp. KO-2023]